MKDGFVVNRNDIDLGTIMHGETREFYVSVTNITTNAITPTLGAQCGCTTPTIDPKTIAPNETALIKVKFDSLKKRGLQVKKFWISANGINTVIVKFTANVI